MLTSLYSVTHGIHELTDTIPAGATTLAETLRGEGYLTASIVANPFPGRNSGLERGVDQLIEYPYLSRYRKKSDGATDSGAVNQAAFPWLETHRDAPFFLYLHSTDPHAPYRPPVGMEAKFADPSQTKRFNRDYEKLRQGEQRHGGGAVFQRASARAKGVDPERWIAEARNRYDAEIAHNDRSIGALLEKLEQLGILDNTLVVVVSDHGEEFLEHGWTTHGHSLYQEQTHTVLIFRHPKLLPAPLRIDEPAQLIDVIPTILDLLDIPAAGIIQGQSLASLMLAEGMRGQGFERKLAVMSSRLAETNVPAAGGIPESRTETYMRLDAGSKLIYRVGAEKAGIASVEYYDRIKDPADRSDQVSEHAEEVARLVDEVQEWIAAQAEVRQIAGAGGKSTMDAATLERLRSLGYVGGGAQ